MTNKSVAKSRYLALFLCLIISAGLVGCSDGQQRFSATYFDCFDTVTEISGYAQSREEFNSTAERIHTMLLKYHKLYDIYNEYEGIINLCSVNNMTADADGVRRAELPFELAELIEYGIQMHEKTKGKLNIAMGSVLELWREAGEAAKTDPAGTKIPDRAALLAAGEHTDISDVAVEGGLLTVTDPLLKFDVGAVAKGFATEKIMKTLEAEGVSGYLLNVGGMACPLGAKPNGEKWTVGIERPDAKGYLKYESTDSDRVVIGGGYLRYYTIGDKKYSHIIDPQELEPPERYAMVCVICDDAALGDALTTALFCMSEAEGRALIGELTGCRVIWVYPDMTYTES